MWPFDPVKMKYPTTWADHSLEYKCLLVFFLSMMFMPLLSRQISAQLELLIAIGLIIAFFTLSVWHRRAFGWRWAGIRASNVLMAGFSLLSVTFFLYYSQPAAEFGPFSPVFLPWELAVMVLGAFFVLQHLKVVDYSESAFRESCGSGPRPSAPTGSEAEPLEVLWKRLVRAAYTIAFVLFWAVLVSRPRFLMNLPQEAMITAFAILFLGGFVIHFFLGIRLLPNYPTLDEIRQRRYSKK